MRVPLEWVGEYPFFLTEKACGLNACYILLGLHNREVDYEALRRQVRISERGTTLADMAAAVRSYGLNAVCVKAKPALLDGDYFPCIVHTEGGGDKGLGHYYVALNRRGPFIVLQDPTTQTTLRMEWTSFLEMWSGNALIIERPGGPLKRYHMDWRVLLGWCSLSFLVAVGVWQCLGLCSLLKSRASCSSPR
jgi:ABC-type bacteriocin/lantibiotic exporter with double-glycine peptidase domain